MRTQTDPDAEFFFFKQNNQIDLTWLFQINVNINIYSTLSDEKLVRVS